jgi:hypothetical protein
LADAAPELLKEWHPSRNLDLEPRSISAGSTRKVWWVCSCGREWSATVGSRVAGAGCPTCGRRRAAEKVRQPSVGESLQDLRPELAHQWLAEENAPVTAADVRPGSHFKAWWKCGCGHQWRAAVGNRVRGAGCPGCGRSSAALSRRRPRAGHSLADLVPALAAEWHPVLNGENTPKQYRKNSSSKVWWVCRAGHEWMASINNRARGSGCPFCKGRRASPGRNLAVAHPDIIGGWHWEKNAGLNPESLTPGSNRRVWWRCGRGHEWQAAVATRVAGHGCPFCKNRRLAIDNSLAAKRPDLAQEWITTRNGAVNPRTVVAGSKVRAWWRCKAGHEWEASVYSRASGSGCPYCAGRKVAGKTALGSVSPQLAMQWHPTLNGDMTAADVTAGSSKRVWWVCERGHVWRAAVGTRTRGSGCPVCRSKSSRLELRLLCELRDVLGDVEWRERVGRDECDLLVRRLSLAVEIDGWPWHKDSLDRDRRKNHSLARAGVEVLRVRHIRLPEFGPNTIVFSDSDTEFDVVARVLEAIMELRSLNTADADRVQQYLSRGVLWNDSGYRTLLAVLPGPEPAKSLAEVCPALAREWDLEKNSPLAPVQFSPGSQQSVWWRCTKGHSWTERIVRRANGYGCPYCSRRRASPEINLAVLHPELMKEWNQDRNGDLDPERLLPTTSRSVWWRCASGHEWQVAVSRRTSAGTRCPECSGRRPTAERNLATLRPDLLAQWDHERNQGAAPQALLPGSRRSVWWRCEKGHSWRAAVADRSGGHGCPFCAKKRASAENCLRAVFPSIASEWHPSKNEGASPEEFTPFSRKKAWWLCSVGHEWEAAIGSRTGGGHNCPFCAGQRASERNSLAARFPEVAAEWHPTLNGELGPVNVSFGSRRVSWWRCAQSHEWQATVKSRTRGSGCPVCKHKRPGTTSPSTTARTSSA